MGYSKDIHFSTDIAEDSAFDELPGGGAAPLTSPGSSCFCFFAEQNWMLLLLMEEILHQLIDSLSHYLQGFIHPRWCRISAIYSMN